MQKTFILKISTLGICFFLLLLCQGVSLSEAVDVRQQIGFSTDELFKQMIDAAENGKYDRIKKGLELLAPLIQVINRDNAVDTDAAALDIDTQIRQAIAKANKSEVILLMQRLITLSINQIFEECNKPGLSSADIKRLVKKAYKEYLVLEPYVKATDFTKFKNLNNNFRYLNSKSDDPHAFNQTCPKIIEDLQSLF